jgi:DNA-binding XRE family transcriptional regulator
MFDRNELKAAMARFGDKQDDLASVLGLSPSGLSVKMNGTVDFRRNEIELILLRYRLSADEVRRIFFADDVTQNVTIANEK